MITCRNCGHGDLEHSPEPTARRLRMSVAAAEPITAEVDALLEGAPAP